MIDSTIQKETYSFLNDYTDVSVSVYENLALLELNEPIKKRLHSLKKRDTRDSLDIKLYNKKVDFLSLKKKENDLDYICQSTKWIGYVIEIRDNSFTAKLTDVDNDTTYEIADFDKSDVSECDLNLLELGATFYWSVGYANQYGQIIKQSLIRFKRSINIEESEFDSIIDKAKELENEIVWE